MWLLTGVCVESLWSIVAPRAEGRSPRRGPEGVGRKSHEKSSARVGAGVWWLAVVGGEGLGSGHEKTTGSAGRGGGGVLG